MAEIVVVGLFHDRFAAGHAAEQLASSGVDPQRIALHGPGESEGAVPFGRFGLPWDDHAFYAEGLRRNRVALTAVVEDVDGNRVADVLDAAGAMDLDAQEEEYRRDGWTPPQPPAGYTGHDEDIGFATYGTDAVLGPVPRHHTDDTPAGLLGRWEQAVMERDAANPARCARRYLPSGAIG